MQPIGVLKCESVEWHISIRQLLRLQIAKAGQCHSNLVYKIAKSIYQADRNKLETE